MADLLNNNMVMDMRNAFLLFNIYIYIYIYIYIDIYFTFLNEQIQNHNSN